MTATYYVSPTGSDSSNGLSTSTPWQTITKVNAATLGPGDQVLFEGGQTWTGTLLYLTDSGTADDPIVIGNYQPTLGAGPATISNGTNDAIYGYNVGGITVQGLDVTGISGSTSYNGIEFYADGTGQLAAIQVTGCAVSGWKWGFLAGGSGATDGWNGITVSGGSYNGNVYGGIETYGADFDAGSPAWNHQNVLIENLTAADNPGSGSVTGQWTGSGIVLGSVNGGTITGCTAYGNGSENGDTSQGPVGIWCYACNDVTIEHCAAYANSTGSGSTGDGDGFDLDVDCTGCVIQYCIAYGNAGAGILAYGGTSDSYWGSTSPNVIRFNLCWGNGTNGASNSNFYGDLTLDGNLAGLQAYNNTCVSQTTGSAQPPALAVQAGTMSGVSLRNNIFAAQSTADAIYAASAFTTSEVLCQGNLYDATSGTALYWGTSHATLAAWRTATSQEIYSSTNTGAQGAPGLVAASTEPAVTDPSSPGPAAGLMLAAGSAAFAAGLPLTADFSIDPGTIDFFGGTLGSPPPIGAAGNIPAAGSPGLAAPAPAGEVWTPLAQKTSGSTTGETLTLTLPQDTQLENTVVLALAGYHGGAITGITLGATSGQFTKIATSGGVNAEFWMWRGITETTGTVTITASAAGIICYAYELSGYAGLAYSVTPDKTSGNTGTGTSWSSGATGTTLNATEIVIGLGYMAGGGTITGPGSGGWHNETAITGVAGATTSSAISGWQVTGTTGAAYTYAGSAGTSAAWGAAAVTFLLMPANSIWAGYQFSEHAAYTGISATFTVPALTAGGGAYNSIWVGMGGPDGGVLQCGIYMTYDHGQPGNATCRPWSWWLAGPGGAGGSGGGSGETWEQTAWPVAAGDSLTCAIEVTSGYMNMTITNSTQDWTYTEAKSVLALNIGFNAWNWPMTAAEVILENEGADGTTGTMPGFGTITFTDITTTPPIAGPPQPLVCVNTYIDDYPEPFSLSGGAGEFTLAYVNYT